MPAAPPPGTAALPYHDRVHGGMREEQRKRGRGPGSETLLTSSQRRPATAVAAACGVVTTVLGLWSAGQARPDRFDAAVDGWLREAGAGHIGALKSLESVGNPVPVTVITAILVLACLLARRWRGAVLVAAAVPAASGLTEGVLKPLTDRTIQGWLSYPSGHATGMFTLATIALVLLTGPSRPRAPRAPRLALVAAAAVLAAAVAAAMVSLGLHYFTDLFGGAAVGIAVVLLLALSLDRYWPRGTRAAAPATGHAKLDGDRAEHPERTLSPGEVPRGT
jgi:membrane-associated phospholipid phosphatase